MYGPVESQLAEYRTPTVSNEPLTEFCLTPHGSHEAVFVLEAFMRVVSCGGGRVAADSLGSRAGRVVSYGG